MKNQKTLAIVYVIVGLVLSVVSIFGYELGLAHRPEFGSYQWAGTLFGIVLLIFGLFRLMRGIK